MRRDLKASFDPVILAAENFLPRAQSLVSTALIAQFCVSGKGKESQCLDNEVLSEDGWRRGVKLKPTSMQL